MATTTFGRLSQRFVEAREAKQQRTNPAASPRPARALTHDGEKTMTPTFTIPTTTSPELAKRHTMLAAQCERLGISIRARQLDLAASGTDESLDLALAADRRHLADLQRNLGQLEDEIQNGPRRKAEQKAKALELLEAFKRQARKTHMALAAARDEADDLLAIAHSIDDIADADNHGAPRIDGVPLSVLALARGKFGFDDLGQKIAHWEYLAKQFGVEV
jgi:hypothetical protein